MDFFGIIIYLLALFLRPQDWMPALLSEPIDFIIFGFIIFASLIKKKLKMDLHNPLQLIFVFWVVWIYFSGFINGKFDLAYEYGYSYFRRFVIFICFLAAVDRPDKVRKVTMLMVIFSAILGVQCITQKLTGIGWAGQPLKQAGLDQTMGGFGLAGRANWVGLWDGMNVLCLLFVIAFSFALQFVSKSFSFFVRVLAAINIFFILFGAYLTKSRGGILALLSVAFFNIIVRFKKSTAIMLSTVLLLSFLALAPSRLTTIDDKAGSSYTRVDMWEEAFDMLRYYPIAGIGRGEFKSYTGVLIAHNSFLELMGETGLIGLFLWLSLIYLSFKTLWQINREVSLAPKDILLHRSLVITILGYLVASIFITAEFELLYILIALAASLASSYGIRLEFNRRDFRNIFLIQIGGIAFFFVFIRVWWLLT